MKIVMMLWRRAVSCLLLSLVWSSTPLATAAEGKVCDVRQSGAKGDGKTLDTVPIQKALDACAEAGGGTVRFPPGVYLSQPITVHSRTTLLLEEGATLKATDDPRDYLPAEVTWEDVLAGRSKGPFTDFLGGKGLTDVAITGKGTIDGSGARWWAPAEEARRRVPGYTLPRPNLVHIIGCKNLKVTGITLQNSPKFHLVPEDCEDVVIEGVTILAPEGAANTDAIDPSMCRRVRISRCLIDVGDDNVAIKSRRKMAGREFACEDLTITDCIFKHGHGMSIGSETVGGVRNVTVRRCRFEGTENGIRIKSSRGRGGTVENLVYEDITMSNVVGAITITTYYPKIPKTDTAQAVTAETPKFQNIRIANLKATSTKDAGVIVGLPESLVQNVVLENVEISAAGSGLTVRNAKGVQLKNVRVTAGKGPPVIVEDAQVDGLHAASSAPEWAQAAKILAHIKAPEFLAREFRITAFGAAPDGKTDCTKAIQQSFEACAKANGGRVVVPAGEFLCGPIRLRSNVDFHLDRGAVLKFTTDSKAYLPAVFTRFEGMECYSYSPLIYAFEQENIAVTGEGLLDGQAAEESWWSWKGKKQAQAGAPGSKAARERLVKMVEQNIPVSQRRFGEGDYLRPSFVETYRCRNVLIEGVRIRRSPMWEIHPTLSTNVIVRGVDILSHGPNNDGCDPESCRDMLIEDCVFDTGDDCIAIKSGRNNDGRRLGVPSENIIIRRCTMKDGHGGVVIGSEVSGGCRNVFAEDCRMDSPNLERVLRLKSNAVRGGVIENIFMRNVSVGQVADAVLQIDFIYEEGANGPHKPAARNVVMENITVNRTPRVLNVVGFPGAEITGVTYL